MGTMTTDNIPVELLRRIVGDVASRKAVDWDAQYGGVCPVCGQRACRVTSTRPWSGAARERMHRCRCGHTFKSVQGK